MANLSRAERERLLKRSLKVNAACAMNATKMIPRVPARTTWVELEKMIDRVLIDNMPARLKEAIDDLLSRGNSKIRVLLAVRAILRSHRRPKRSLTMLSVEAYLAAKPNVSRPGLRGKGRGDEQGP
jgi:hypothetical protein